MATVESPMSSNLSNKVEEGLGSSSNKSPYTPSPRKLKRLQSAYTDESHSESKCKRCGWRYPIQNPDSRVRRHHKKICPGRSSLGSDEEIQSSSGGGDLHHSDSAQSFVLTRDHEVPDTAKSRKRLPFDEMEQDKATGRGAAQRGAVRAADDELQHTSAPLAIDSGHEGSGTGEEKVGTSTDKEGPGSHDSPKPDPQEAHSRRTESYLERGSDSGASSAADELESDPSYDMPFESSDVGEASKRDDSLPSDDDMLEEEKRYGASQHQDPHAHPKGAAESSRAAGNRTDSQWQGTPMNVANLISKYEQTQNPQSLPSDVNYTALSGNKRSMPSAKNGQGGPLSLKSKKDHTSSGEIVSTEANLKGKGLSTGREEEDDLELFLKRQKNHDIICPRCGSQITDRVIVSKRKITTSSKNGARLPVLKEISSESLDQDRTVQAIKAGAGVQGNWIERCLSYLGVFRRDTSTPPLD